ncbi:MAG: hypothetical protein ACXV6K_06550 [Halobacteriota archaeon]
MDIIDMEGSEQQRVDRWSKLATLVLIIMVVVLSLIAALVMWIVYFE